MNFCIVRLLNLDWEIQDLGATVLAHIKATTAEKPSADGLIPHGVIVVKAKAAVRVPIAREVADFGSYRIGGAFGRIRPLDKKRGKRPRAE